MLPSLRQDVKLYRCNSAEDMKCKVHSFNKGAQTEIQGQEVTLVLCLMGIQLIGNHFKMFKWRRVWEGSEGHVTDSKVLQLEIIMAYQLGACILGLFGGQ